MSKLKMNLCVTLDLLKGFSYKMQKIIFRCPKQEGNALANFGSSSGLESRLLHSKITQMFSLEFWLEMNDLMLNYSHFVAIIKTFFDLVLSVAYL